MSPVVFLKRVKQVFCAIAPERKATVNLFICCVKHCICDTYRGLKGKAVPQRTGDFHLISEGEQ